MADITPITRERIAETETTIRPHVRRTPLVRLGGSDFGLSLQSLTFKLEMLQHSGSFKARGAFANLLLRKTPEVGVVAASGGNHGVAVAFAAQRLNVPATIFVLISLRLPRPRLSAIMVQTSCSQAPAMPTR